MKIPLSLCAIRLSTSFDGRYCLECCDMSDFAKNAVKFFILTGLYSSMRLSGACRNMYGSWYKGFMGSLGASPAYQVCNTNNLWDYRDYGFWGLWVKRASTVLTESYRPQTRKVTRNAPARDGSTCPSHAHPYGSIKPVNTRRVISRLHTSSLRWDDKTSFRIFRSNLVIFASHPSSEWHCPAPR